jgi:hypothetical protein
MRRLAASALLLLSLSPGGCQFPSYIAHNFAYESCRCLEDAKERRTVEKYAKEAWQEHCGAGGETASFSEHYHAGFMDGFCYYVIEGGDGQPPAVPPRCYWKEYYRTPEGRVSVQQWFDGYRHGAQVACAGHYRERELLPLSRPLQEEPSRLPSPSVGTAPRDEIWSHGG